MGGTSSRQGRHAPAGPPPRSDGTATPPTLVFTKSISPKNGGYLDSKLLLGQAQLPNPLLLWDRSVLFVVGIKPSITISVGNSGVDMWPLRAVSGSHYLYLVRNTATQKH